MKFTESGSEEPLWIDEFDGVGFVVHGERHEGSILLDAHGVRKLEGGFQDLNAERLAKDIDESDVPPDIIIVGSGKKQAFLHPKIIMAMQQKGVGIDSMMTDSAVRTVNIMRADGREVFAYLFV